MSSGVRRRANNSHAEDAWWSLDEADEQQQPASAAVHRDPRRSGRPHRRAALPLRLAVAPIRLLAQWARTNAHVRRAGIRFIVLMVAVMILTGAVSVILLNNVVISRTAELGKLDDRRRELRRDNAMLGADAARLSVPPVIIKRASTELGMVQPADMPTYLYLDRHSRTLTPFQRMKVAQLEMRQRELAASREAAKDERAKNMEQQP